MRLRHRGAAAFLIAAAVVIGVAPATRAQEASRGQAPTPDSIENLGGAIEGEPEEEKARPIARFPWLQRWVQNWPAFLRDTELTFRSRTYYFKTENPDRTKSEAWTLGGAFDYRSGWLKERARIGATLYTSQKLYAPSDRDGTGLLREGQLSYTVPGQAWLEVKHEAHNLRVYRQLVDLPYVNPADTRMTPNTFEAYLARGRFEAVPRVPALGGIDYTFGWIDRIRRRDLNEFIPMSEAAGAEGSDNGMLAGRFFAEPGEGIRFGGVNLFVPDTMNTLYVEGSYLHEVTPTFPVRLDAQFTWQTSVGKNLLSDSSFDALTMAARAGFSWKGMIFTLGGSHTTDSSEIRAPWGEDPSYLALMQSSFNRGGETALLAGVSYDMGHWLEGLSGFINVAQGFDAEAVTAETAEAFSLSDQWEFDATIDYQPPHGPLTGLWLRLRFSQRDFEDAKATTQVRAIVSYDLTIL